MKLNLCCGDDVRDGYINIDIRKTRPSVLVINIEAELLRRFESNTADEIIALDCIEHMSWRRIDDLIKDLNRVLICGGKLFIRVPDMEAIAKKVILNPSFKFGDLEGWRAISYWVYGGQEYPENTHKAGFTIPSLKRLLESNNFTIINIANDGGSNIICQAVKKC
jgi:hypothetical protein